MTKMLKGVFKAAATELEYQTLFLGIMNKSKKTFSQGLAINQTYAIWKPLSSF